MSPGRANGSKTLSITIEVNKSSSHRMLFPRVRCDLWLYYSSPTKYRGEGISSPMLWAKSGLESSVLCCQCLPRCRVLFRDWEVRSETQCHLMIFCCLVLQHVLVCFRLHHNKLSFWWDLCSEKSQGGSFFS